MKKRFKNFLNCFCVIVGGLIGVFALVLYILILANVIMPFWLYLLTSILFNVFLLVGIFDSILIVIKFIKEKRK